MRTLSLRQLHGYLGAFIAPSVVFFALTGSLQLFNLHEAAGGYHPAAVIEKLARVHKDQVFALDHDHGPQTSEEPGTAGDKPPAPADDDHRPALPTVLLKYYFLLVAAGVSLSTVLGVWIGLAHSRGKTAMIALLLAGCAVPIVLAAMSAWA